MPQAPPGPDTLKSLNPYKLIRRLLRVHCVGSVPHTGQGELRTGKLAPRTGQRLRGYGMALQTADSRPRAAGRGRGVCALCGGGGVCAPALARRGCLSPPARRSLAAACRPRGLLSKRAPPADATRPLPRGAGHVRVGHVRVGGAGLVEPWREGWCVMGHGPWALPWMTGCSSRWVTETGA